MEGTDRVRLLTAPIDLARAPGLEFGPLDRPIVDRRTAEVRYIDHLSTEGLRAKYQDHPLVDTSRLCDVDFVIDGSPLARIVGKGYGYVVASHVAEHVPDLVGWLAEITEILQPGGVLALALPDMRTTFDTARPLTLPSDLIGAHLARRTAPTPEQVAEHHMFALRRGEQISWGIVAPRSELRHVHDLNYAMDMARAAASGDHVDVHCWVFTPQSFMANLEVLRSVGLTDLRPTAAPHLRDGEFITHLSPDPAGPADHLEDDWDSAFGDSAVGDGAVGVTRARDSDARSELQAIYRSTSWRVTAPLRRISSAIRSRRSA